MIDDYDEFFVDYNKSPKEKKIIELTKNIDRYLFFDIETISGTETLDELDSRLQESWKRMCIKQHKFKDLKGLGFTDEQIYQKESGLMAEFNKILTIAYGTIDEYDELSVGAITLHKDCDTEEELLIKFRELLMDNPRRMLAGYNISGFDIPVVAKKFVKYGLNLPERLNSFGKKSWDIARICFDIMHFYRCDTNDFLSLGGLSVFLDLPTPKDELSGEMVTPHYYSHDHKTAALDIERYCKKDVLATMAIFLKLQKTGVIY